MITLEQQLARVWNPKVKPSPLTWAEENVWLDKRFTPRPGRYDCGYTPYMRGPHEWFGDPRIRQISLVKAAQIAGTTWLANCMMWVIAEEPGPILYVTSTGENAKSWSERELIPRIKNCVPLKSLMPENEDDFRKSEMHFQSCTLRLTGSNSEGNLASRPIRFLFADEVDKWPPESGKEAPALQLAKARTNFYRRTSKICVTSTPTIEAGAVWKEFLEGSQHYFFVPCPECGEMQPLVFEQIKWPEHHRDLAGGWDLDGVSRDSYYECRACQAKWHQSIQHKIIAAGDWKATNAKAPADHISAHISSLYSPQFSWGDLARMFLQKKSTPGGLHDFYNNFLGLPWENRAAQVKEEAVLSLRSDYRLTELPVEPRILTCCADVGERETHWSVEARIESGESWVIDYGTVLSPEDLITETFLSARRYQFGDRWISPRFGLIDSGYNTERVYEVCARSRGLFMPSKGSTASFGTWTLSQVSGYPQLRLVTYVDFTAKVEIYLNRINKKLPPQLHFPADVGQDFLDGHIGQQLLESPGSRHAPKYWKKVVADHYGDCTKLHAVAHWVMKSSNG
jgi:phage terminase large subunit GpA-like protein